MAGVPATTANELQDAMGDKSLVASSGKGGNDLLAGFGGLDILRQLGLMVGLMASVAIGFAVVLWSQGSDYQPIYGNMQGYDASVIMEVLDTNGMDYRVEPSSGVILVKSSEMSSIKLRLASAGVARYDGTGYELLDEDQALGTSQFMEANKIKRSQEGELQRTITSFRNVQSARVHIAIPQRSVFMRSSNKPTASVFLTLNSGASLSDTQIDAIANLVASSVPELHVDDVTIVDQKGNLLSREDVNLGLELADKQFQYTRKFEQSLVERVRGILSPIVGVDGFQAQVTADIDFTQEEYAAESYDPANQMVRSEQTLEERSAEEGLVGGIPGALSNQPPADGLLVDEFTPGTDPAAGLAGNRRVQATRNYELGRKISYTNNDPVSVNRISVAVVLDDHPGVGEEPSSTWDDAQINKITTLVKDAVGFNQDRGDSVTVINNRFAPVNFGPDAAESLWQQSWLQNLVKQVAAGLFILLMVLGVLRPVLANLAKVSPESRQLALAATQGEFSDFAMAERAMLDDDVRFSGQGDAMLAGPGNQGSYDHQIDQVRGLIAEIQGELPKLLRSG